MGKSIFVCTVVAAASVGCKKDENKGSGASGAERSVASSVMSSSASEPASSSSQSSVASALTEALAGSYVGEFKAVEFKRNKEPSYSNRINITITKVENDTVTGLSVVAGNKRPFTGPLLASESGWKFSAKEPGDDKYDGEFLFSVSPDKQTLVGTWQANNGKLAVTKRKYTLKRRVFSYNPKLELPKKVTWASIYDTYEGDKEESLTEDVLKFNPSVKKLTAAKVENMYQRDLEVMRNSIYARHGYSFKNRRMRYIFDEHVDWYMPVSTNVTKQLTAVEKHNIDLIKRYEEHAETYYDEFGR